MKDVLSLIQSLTRPRLLIRAARHGLVDYSRDHALARIIGVSSDMTAIEIVQKLVEVEGQMERARKEDDGSYSVARHIELLVALIAESNLLPKPPEPDVS